MATYQSLYEQALDKNMASGGTATEMDAIVDEVNALGGWNYKPSMRYKTWLSSLKNVMCDACEDLFVPEGIPSIKDDALCARCLTRKENENAPESTP